MELISSYICKASEIGIHGNLFGKVLLTKSERQIEKII